MLAGTIIQPYTWKWAVDQNEASLAAHLATHQQEVLQSLAADALKTVPSESVLHCSVKILKTLTSCDIEYERLNTFIHVLKANGLIAAGDNEHAKLFLDALYANNVEMAKNLLVHFGPPHLKSFDPYDVIRMAIENKNQVLICFILENGLITSRSMLKSLFGTMCENRLYGVIELFFGKISGFQLPQETITHNLREALRKDQVNLVKLLLLRLKISLKADLESKTNLLFFACCLKPDAPHLVDLLIKSYKSASDFSPERYSALVTKACKKAAIFGNSETVKSLIDEKATVDSGIISSLLYQRQDECVIELLDRFPLSNYYDLLMISIRVGAEFVVIKLLTDFEEQILSNYPVPRDEFYFTLLEAAFQDRNSMAAYFCMDRVKKPLPESVVEKLIGYTLDNESEGLMILMLENHLIPKSRYFPFLIQSARLGFLECTRLVIKRGVNVNLQDRSGLTPLMAAAAGGHVRIQDLLISAGAALDTFDNGGNAALHYAAYVGSESSVKLLITRGAKINCVNLQKATPLHIAIEEGSIEVAKMLLFYWADSTLQNECGETALHSAINVDSPSHEIIELLAANQRLLTMTDHLGQTPFSLLLKKNILKPIRQYFFPYPGLAYLGENLRDLDRIAVNSIHLIIDSNNLSYAIPLELSLLMNHYPLAHALSRRLSQKQWEMELSKLKLRYHLADLGMIIDARHDLHPAHFLEGQLKLEPNENKNPIFPAAMDLIKDCILEAFDKINFDNKSKRNYRNPVNLRNDGDGVKPERIKEGLVELFARVKNRIPYLGTPKENTPELKEWYEKLERLLYDLSQLILKKNDEDEKASLLIDVGIAGLHCGGRWVGTLRQLYLLEMKSDVVLTLPDIIKTELNHARSGILQILTDQGNVHQYNHFMFLIGEELGLIAKNGREKYKDALANAAETKETLLTKFYKIYNPNFIIDYVSRDIDNLSKKVEFRDILIDWFKENVPSDWNIGQEAQERQYSFLMESLYDEKQNFKVKRTAIIYLLQKLNTLC